MAQAIGLQMDSRRRRSLAAAEGSKKTVIVALTGNLVIAVAKFAAAWFTGSSAMLSEGAHSLVDCGNEVLLLYGMRRAKRPADLAHPFGHGREVYFWSFVVALLFFALGAGVSFYEGVQHLLHPEDIRNFSVTYAVLLVAMLCEGVSLRVAVKEFARQKGELGYVAAIRRSKNPATFTVLLEDSAALLGLGIAFVGILGAQLLRLPALDGIASIGISLVLGTMAVFLATETKGLLLGEQASPELEAAILRAASEDPAVHMANGVYTVHIGPEQIVAELSVAFEPAADAGEIERSVERIEAAIRRDYPEIIMLFVKPQTHAMWRARLAGIEATSSPAQRASGSRRRAIWRQRR
ncbi:cation diffusion facilitator family transporter [Dongia sp. agr-C8]